ncbi:hypothetical protein [Kitasatospora sp. HPMI-4]|uniref:hypothetical protein n=1 Tax=Kitasatospora sp. HPMI-4 TaxID=3448443 RepID=UPI003F1B2416
MISSTDQLLSPGRPAAARLPWPGPPALSAAGFVTIMTEALPAGVLPAISSDLDVSRSGAGRAVTLLAGVVGWRATFGLTSAFACR